MCLAIFSLFVIISISFRTLSEGRLALGLALTAQASGATAIADVAAGAGAAATAAAALDVVVVKIAVANVAGRPRGCFRLASKKACHCSAIL